jgi:hypothetical protein
MAFPRAARFAFVIALACGVSQAMAATSEVAQKTFATPEQAAEALIAEEPGGGVRRAGPREDGGRAGSRQSEGRHRQRG